MEAKGCLKIYERTAAENIIHLTPFVGDADAGSFAACAAANPHGPEYPLVKDECIVHVVRRLGNALRRFKSSRKGIMHNSG